MAFAVACWFWLFRHSHIQSVTHSIADLFIASLTHSLPGSLSHSLTISLTHGVFTCSLTQSRVEEALSHVCQLLKDGNAFAIKAFPKGATDPKKDYRWALLGYDITSSAHLPHILQDALVAHSRWAMDCRAAW